ncbi:MAG: hypothetical protein WCP07_02980 [bacterium]
MPRTFMSVVYRGRRNLRPDRHIVHAHLITDRYGVTKKGVDEENRD